MCDDRNSLSALHRMLQENMHTINMKIKLNDDLRQTIISKDHNDLLQFHIDLCLISTDKDEKFKKLENMRKDIDHSIELFQHILLLQNDRNQNSFLNADIVNSVLRHESPKSADAKMFHDLTQRDLRSIVERLENAKSRLFDIAEKDGIQLQGYGETTSKRKKIKLKKLKEQLVAIEETLEEKRKSMEELKIFISEKTQERNNLREEIERMEPISIWKKPKCSPSLITKKGSLHSQIVVHYDLTNCIEYKNEVEWDSNSDEAFDVFSN